MPNNVSINHLPNSHSKPGSVVIRTGDTPAFSISCTAVCLSVPRIEAASSVVKCFSCVSDTVVNIVVVDFKPFAFVLQIKHLYFLPFNTHKVLISTAICRLNVPIFVSREPENLSFSTFILYQRNAACHLGNLPIIWCASVQFE